MLELPSASASPSAPSLAAASAARYPDKQEAGFQGRLREVLGSQDAQKQVGVTQVEASQAQRSEAVKGVDPGLLAPESLALGAFGAVDQQFPELTAGDALSTSLAQAVDVASMSFTPPLVQQGSGPTKSEALENASMFGAEAGLPMPVAITSSLDVGSISDAAPPLSRPVEGGLMGDAQPHAVAAGSANMAAVSMPESAQLSSTGVLKPGGGLISDQIAAQTAAVPSSATLAEVALPQAAVQEPGAGPIQLMGQVLPSQSNMMVADRQILAAANQQRGLGAVGQPAGQAAPVQPAIVQPSDQNLAVPEQQAVITALAAGPSQVAATQPGKPFQPVQAAPEAGIPAPVEAAEAAKSDMPSTLLAQSLGAGGAAQDAAAILPSEAAEASLHAVDPAAPKTVIAKHVVENESHIIPGQGFGFEVSDGTLSRADAPMQTASARELPAPPPPVRQLAPVLVSLALGGGNEALTIMLDPGELGRVEISIGQGKDAGLVRIVAERPETLALLQRDQRELDRALNQAGLGDMARSLSFSLASDQGRQQHQHAAQDGANRFAALTSGQEAERALVAPIQAPLRASTSLIDLAV